MGIYEYLMRSNAKTVLGLCILMSLLSMVADKLGLIVSKYVCSKYSHFQISK